ncbi:MAG: hypothetical protein NVV82_21950 [Sporocytophaga sp.]|nr:hypothetical protein [Sporocytophaga sp.]
MIGKDENEDKEDEGVLAEGTRIEREEREMQGTWNGKRLQLRSERKKL